MLANCWCSELHAPSIICFVQFIPFHAVFLAHLHLILVTPGHSSSLPTPFPSLCSAVSGVSPLDSGIFGISPPQPQGCAPALSGAAMTVLQPYLAKPYLCIMGHHAWRQELQPLTLLPSRSLAQSKPRAGCDCSGWVLPTGSIPRKLHWQGSQDQVDFFWAFFLPILTPKIGGLQL